MTTRQIAVQLEDFGEGKPKIVYKPSPPPAPSELTTDPPCVECKKLRTCTKKQAQECIEIMEWALQ